MPMVLDQCGLLVLIKMSYVTFFCFLFPFVLSLGLSFCHFLERRRKHAVRLHLLSRLHTDLCTGVTSSNASCTNLHSSLKAAFACRCGVCSVNVT